MGAPIDNAAGRCLCGAVRFRAARVAAEVHACHCGMCRRWSGGPELAVEAGTEVVFEGAENIAVFRSSDWAERAFCRICGSHLFFRTIETGGYSISPGLFDDESAFVLTEEIFIDHKPAFYGFAQATEKLIEAEVIEKYAPKTGTEEQG